MAHPFAMQMFSTLCATCGYPSVAQMICSITASTVSSVTGLPIFDLNEMNFSQRSGFKFGSFFSAVFKKCLSFVFLLIGRLGRIWPSIGPFSARLWAVCGPIDWAVCGPFRSFNFICDGTQPWPTFISTILLLANSSRPLLTLRLGRPVALAICRWVMVV